MLDSYSLKLPLAVYAGENALDRLPEILDAGPERCVGMFCDAAIWKLGLAQPAVDAIEASGRTVRVFTDLAVEPTYEQVQAVVDEFRASGAEMVLAIGGGSVMDAAKLVAVLATDDYTITNLLKDPGRAVKQVRSVMVPTTAGTGAEATPNAIVLVPEDELKVGIVSNVMMADAVILDAEMIRNLPRAIAAATGIDALCHAIECYTGTKANPFSDTFALAALELILGNIEAACDDADAMEAKRAMQLASFYAGIAITASGTTAVHALSYPLGGRYHIAHGVSNAILLVPVMRFNEPAIADRLATVYDRCLAANAIAPVATEQEKAAAVIAELDRIVRHLDIPTSLADLGVADADLDGLVEAGMKVTRLLVNNRRPVTPDDARALYEQIL